MDKKNALKAVDHFKFAARPGKNGQVPVTADDMNNLVNEIANLAKAIIKASD